MINKENIDRLVEKVKGDFLKVNSDSDGATFLLEVSARHLHISKEHLDMLFGKGYELTPMKELSQPGQFAAKEMVRIIGPMGEYDNVRILGPERAETQVELSMTDCFNLGIEPIIKMSGEIDNTPGCILWGPNGHVELKKGVIVAKRHFHCTPSTAKVMGVSSNDSIGVEIKGERGGILKNIIVRVSDKYADAIHIDTDEGNGLGIKTGDRAYIVK